MGHLDTWRTYDLLRVKYWWPNMLMDINKYISSCTSCTHAKVPRMLPTSKLLPLPMAECPWSYLAVDFLTDLPEFLGNIMIIVIVDQFSKSLSLVPLPGLSTAFRTAELTFNHVFRYFGISEYIIRGQGMQFTSRVWSSFMEKLELFISLWSGYHPQSNGQSECANQKKCF